MLAAVLLALLFLNWLVFRAVFQAPALRLSVLPVAKGEAVLVETPGRRTYLINAGADASVLRSLGAALPFWQRHLDALILTDASAENAGGAPQVLARYRTSSLVRSESRGSASLEAALANAGVAPVELVRGERLALGGGAYADALLPPEASPAQPLLMRIGYGGSSVLIGSVPGRAGDWEARADANLPAPGLVIASTTPPGSYILDGTSLLHRK